VSSGTELNTACTNVFELGPGQALQFPRGRTGTLARHLDDRFRQGSELSAVRSEAITSGRFARRRVVFQAEYEGSIPFTRSEGFGHLPSGQLFHWTRGLMLIRANVRLLLPLPRSRTMRPDGGWRTVIDADAEQAATPCYRTGSCGTLRQAAKTHRCTKGAES